MARRLIANVQLPRISPEEVKEIARKQGLQLLHFAYNRETSEILGKTWQRWGLTIGFLSLFYAFLAAIFAVHMVIFYAVTPQPGRDAGPANYGRYAYPNYPNSPIDFIAVPNSLGYNGNQATWSSSKRGSYEGLLSSATLSGVPDVCMNTTIAYGYDIGTPCIFFRVQKVLGWAPEDINASLSTASTLPMSCSTDTVSGLNVGIVQQPVGLPLNVPNHMSSTNNRSYPFRGKDSGYMIPVMALVIDLTPINTTSVTQRAFSIRITCGVDLSAVGLTNPPAPLSRLYEIPRSASTIISVTL